MKLSNLPRDLIEEILSKLPVTSRGPMRLTCKKLNQSFKEKHIFSEEESMAIMLMNDKIYLMDINLHNPSINRKAELISLKNISRIIHCDGLLLCVREDEHIVVWNPYTTETKWIKPRNFYQRWDHYSIGYKKKGKSLTIHKILRFREDIYINFCINIRCEILDLMKDNSSWRVLNKEPRGWYLLPYSVSLKGDTYWLATETIWEEKFVFLICFDFTKERFGQRLPLPVKSYDRDNVALSSVRDEQAVVLLQRRCNTYEFEIWVTRNIEPETVTWKKLFLAVDMTSFIGHRRLEISFGGIGFFIDEEKKIVVVMDENEDNTRHIAYIFGANGYMKQVDLGEVRDNSCDSCYVRISRNLE